MVVKVQSYWRYYLGRLRGRLAREARDKRSRQVRGLRARQAGEARDKRSRQVHGLDVCCVCCEGHEVCGREETMHGDQMSGREGGSGMERGGEGQE